MRHLYFLWLFAFISCQTSNHELERWEEHAANTTIIRDDFGIPHIYGKTDANAVFGLLYAQCEDDFPRVEQNYIWAIGRLAEIEGEKALYSDLRARLFMTKDEAIEEYENSPQWLKELCVAFADGINYYLHTHPEVKPKLLARFEPWMPMYFSEGSIGGDIERVDTERIMAFYENNTSLVLRDHDDLVRYGQLEEPSGSNGIAISGKLTESGNAMLLINPHTSFYFRGEVHMVSEEGLSAYGAVTWGQFFVYQGFNEKTGWMHTSTYTDVMDEYLITLDEENGELMYKYGLERRSVQKNEVTLHYRIGDQMNDKTFTIYRTHHGPITHKIGDHWVATAMMWEPSKALEQSYSRTKKNGHDEFRSMMDIRTNSSNNTVYADADGNIAYYHGNFIPIRNELFDFTQPLDGSDPETDWKGLHPVDECIVVVNPENGWIQNCNSTPFTCASEYSPKKEDYPLYMSIDRENFRGIHAIRLLEGRDGFTLDKLIELAYDPHLPGFEILIPGLLAAYDKASLNDPDLGEAIEVLRDWDYKAASGSVAMTLAHFYATISRSNGSAPNGLSIIEEFKYYAEQSPVEERLELYRSVVNLLTTDFGTWKIPWGEVNRFQRLTGRIDEQFDDTKPSIPVSLASGRWGALAAYGSRRFNTKNLYGYRGNSFVAVVEFGDKVKAKSLLAGGQNNDPDSPHFKDQMEMYANAEFKEVAYYREDVEARAVKTYKPGDK